MSALLDVDSYKASHYLQYPPDTNWMQSYFEARSGEAVWFGLQYLLKSLMCEVPNRFDVLEAGELFARHGLPFNYRGWCRIADLGYLPIKVRALPEGTRVPQGVPLMTVESTDAATFWIVSWLETQFSRLWYPCTVATQSHRLRQMVAEYLKRTSDSTDDIEFKVHDFGARGCSSRETAAIGGLAHLTSFEGTDTVSAIELARQYYGCDMAGFSIPASEHSTITSWGKERESIAYANMLQKFTETGKTFACVVDSYDASAAIEMLVKMRPYDDGCTLVVRPDSGDPVKESLRVLEQLKSLVGGSTNSKGFFLLNPRWRVIYGDGINQVTIAEILKAVVDAQFSTANICFGMGSALLQEHRRDDLGFAYKTCAVKRGGSYYPVFKEPISSPGKKSKGGVLDTCRDRHGVLEGRSRDPAFANPSTAMRDVFEDGALLVEEDLYTVRRRLWP